jgi:isochorismate pyruvate lyase
MTDILKPEDCTTMTEVRAGVDDVDRKIIALLARRFGYMDAAARIKPDRSTVRDEKRKAEVLDRIRGIAGEHGLPREVIANLYDQLIEACIAYELDEFDRIRS